MKQTDTQQGNERTNVTLTFTVFDLSAAAGLVGEVNALARAAGIELTAFHVGACEPDGDSLRAQQTKIMGEILACAISTAQQEGWDASAKAQAAASAFNAGMATFRAAGALPFVAADLATGAA